MRKIIVPTDFSENAFNALKYACQVFKYEWCEFYLVHAYADEVYAESALDSTTDFGQLKAKVHKNAEKRLGQVLGELANYSPNPKHKYMAISAFGALIDEVNTLVETENIDIVVMGTKGVTNDRAVTFGSNALAVIKYVACPVLAVPKGYAYKVPKEILFPTNYLVPYRKRELKLLCDLTGSFRSNIHFLYIDALQELPQRQKDNQEFLKAGLQKATLHFETSLEKDRTKAILGCIDVHRIDLLVMVNSRHSHLEFMLYNSTLDKIGMHIQIPFLVLQNLAR